MTNYKVELHEKGTQNYGSVVVDRVVYEDIGDGYWVKLEGTDPHCYPDFVQEAHDLRWFSKNLTFMVNLDDPIDVVGVATTDEPIPEPDVNY